MKYVLLALIVIVIISGGIVYFSKGGFLTVSDMQEEHKKNLITSKLSIEGKAPEITGIHDWINTEPLTLAELRGKVVLVDFWTYSCINCIRTFPHTREWHEKYKDYGFVFLGVHTPEFKFEKKKENVEREAEENNLTYPIALDNDYATWLAYNNRYWPAHYLIDAEGNIRYHHFGEGQYDKTESAIQQLLLEAKLISVDQLAEINEALPQVDFSKIGTPEIYFGYLRIKNLGNMVKGVQANTAYEFPVPDEMKENLFYLTGSWKIGPEESTFVGTQPGKILLRYKASKANMVLDADRPIDVEILLDGKPLTANNKGASVILKDGHSVMTVDKPALYHLVDTKDEYDWHTLEIIVPEAGLQAFTFTFG